jgi:hypothetical protein
MTFNMVHPESDDNLHQRMVGLFSTLHDLKELYLSSNNASTYLPLWCGDGIQATPRGCTELQAQLKHVMTHKCTRPIVGTFEQKRLLNPWLGCFVNLHNDHGLKESSLCGHRYMWCNESGPQCSSSLTLSSAQSDGRSSTTATRELPRTPSAPTIVPLLSAKTWTPIILCWRFRWDWLIVFGVILGQHMYLSSPFDVAMDFRQLLEVEVSSSHNSSMYTLTCHLLRGTWILNNSRSFGCVRKTRA